MSTLKEIAAKAGVSIETVSRVLSGKNKEIWPSTIQRAKRIRQIAESLNFVPNAAARSLRTRRTHVVGVLLRNAPENKPYYRSGHELLLGACERLEKEGYIVAIIHNSVIHNSDVHQDTARVFRENLLEGLMVIANSQPDINQRISRIVPKCFWLECNIWHAHNCMRRDELQVGRLVVESLAQAGYRKLLWSGEKPGQQENQHFSIIERFEGISQVCRERSLELECVQPTYTDNFPELQINEMRKCLSREVAVIAYNTLHAPQLIYAEQELGLRVGIDFGLACCDESAETRYCWPQLSRVNFDRFKAGYEGADAFVRFLNLSAHPPTSRKIPSRWIPGSTAPKLENK